METSKTNKVNVFKTLTKGKMDYTISFEDNGEFRIFLAKDLKHLAELVFLNKWANSFIDKNKGKQLTHFVIDCIPPATAVVFAKEGTLGVLCPLTKREIRKFFRILSNGIPENLKELEELL